MNETMVDRIRRIDVLEHLRNDIQSLSHFLFYKYLEIKRRLT